MRTSISGDSEYWLVKGYEHPPGKVVAVPYRRRGRRLDPRSFHTPGSLEWTLTRLPCTGWPAPAIDVHRVLPVNPRLALQVRWREIPTPVKMLLRELNPDWAGLTGSWAVFQESSRSDVDILVYIPQEEVPEAIRAIARSGLVRPCSKPRSEHPVRGVVRRVLDSCITFGGEMSSYTLRLLRSLDARECTTSSEAIGVYEGLVEVRPLSPHDPYLVPARYAGVMRGEEIVIESWRTSYQELPPGLYRARLRLSVDVRSGTIVGQPDIGGYMKAVGVGVALA
ncbi:MAG: hypothetical protein F7B20_06465 [Aeropyrum sp.]|nr:hypothetical protein [Aeropyrum sp.]MCE4616322.1 hypothetical protein [Aeropyrum sp.]